MVRASTLVAGTGAIGALVLARRAAERARADADFYTWTGPRPVADVRGDRLMAPTFFHRVDSFGSLHRASYRAVRDLLPSDLLRPVRLPGGRTVVMVWALRYHEITAHHADGTPGTMTPYGEVMVTALVTRGRAAPGVPLFVQALRPRSMPVGGFVLHLPVTTSESRDLGRDLYGFPKFVADMDYVEEPRLRRVTVSEDDVEILTLTVRPGGRLTTDRMPVVAYSAHHGELLQTVAPQLGHRQVRFGGAAGTLELGEHPVSDALREIELSAEPLLAASYLDDRLLLPAGVPIGPARAYGGYGGADRDRGRLTVEYPDSGPIDCYAEVPRLLPGPVAAG